MRFAQGSFRQPAPRRPEGSERVTVILQKAALDSQSAQTEATNVDPPTTTCNVPVPVSAFAPIIGSGDSGKSSTDFSPFAGLTAAKEESGSDAETESDEGREVPTLVRGRLAQTVEWHKLQRGRVLSIIVPSRSHYLWGLGFLTLNPTRCTQSLHTAQSWVPSNPDRHHCLDKEAS